MTPNDMPPLLTAATGAYRPTQGERARFLPTERFARARSRTTEVGASALLTASSRWTRFTE